MASWYGFRPFSYSGPVASPTMEKMAASQVLHRGDAVIKNANGYIEIALAASAAIYGVAGSTKTTTAADEKYEIPVYGAGSDSYFIGVSDGTYAKTMEGVYCDIIGATGAMRVDENAAVKKVVRIIQDWLAEGDSIGANTPVIFQFVLSQFGGVTPVEI